MFITTRHRRSVAVAAGSAAVLILTAGCTSSGNDGKDNGSATAGAGVPLVAEGKLTTCTHLPYPPFQFEQDGEVVGFDVSLIDLVADELGVKQEIIDTPFENFKTGAFLNAGKCDLAAAGITITEDRKKNVDFSDPYFEATQAVLATKKSGITSLDDVRAKNKKIGAQAQTTGEEYAQSKGFDPVSFESSDAVINGLRTGQIDAVVIDYPVVQGWLKDKANSQQFQLAGNLETGEQYGIMVKKGNSKLRSAINKVLGEAKADGNYKSIYEKWIGPLPQDQS
ncbi:transporter substrate-binding domain-containing protein [Actinacidiphila glaucinigra]|uniref:transporter substrate-binding domain-containing protein n=1 Tax=Actinacidiphila glaucinigra TaxID=235986 RepID=UPI0035DBC874